MLNSLSPRVTLLAGRSGLQAVLPEDYIYQFHGWCNFMCTQQRFIAISTVNTTGSKQNHVNFKAETSGLYFQTRWTMRSQCISTCTGQEMATQRHSDVWTTFRQVPAVLAAVCIAPAPWLLPFCLHSVTWNLTRPEREGEGEWSRLTFLCFPANQDYSSYLMMQKQSNMTFEVTILYCGTATPLPSPSVSTSTYMDC